MNKQHVFNKCHLLIGSHFPLSFMCFAIFVICAFGKTAILFVFSDRLHAKEDLHQSAWLDVLGVPQTFSGMTFSLGICMSFPVALMGVCNLLELLVSRCCYQPLSFLSFSSTLRHPKYVVPLHRLESRKTETNPSRRFWKASMLNGCSAFPLPSYGRSHVLGFSSWLWTVPGWGRNYNSWNKTNFLTRFLADVLSFEFSWGTVTSYLVLEFP